MGLSIFEKSNVVKTPASVDILFNYLKGLINREDLIRDIWNIYKKGNYLKAYSELESFIVKNKPLVVKKEFTKESLRLEISKELNVSELPDNIKFFFTPKIPSNLIFFSLITKQLASSIKEHLGENQLSEIVRGASSGTSLAEIPYESYIN